LIISFADTATEDIFDGKYSKKAIQRLHPMLWGIAQRKLHMIKAAKKLEDLRIPPANHLEALRGELKGKYSIRINGQYRVIFRWLDQDAEDVQIIDYH
jgi:toxin HigB-1